jgi:4-hydroxybenzoate polyprenyltransferase
VKSSAASLRALAATARLANLPSVVTNVSLGMILGHSGLDPWSAGLALLAAASLYLSGGFLNDWADRGWDARHRPERGLPSGLFPARAYLSAGVFFGLLGLAAAALTGWTAVLIAAGIAISIGIYTALHKKSAWSVVPMGFCRGLLPVLGLAATGEAGMWPAALIAGVGLMAHVAGISWLARGESLPAHAPARVQSSWLFPVCMFLMAFVSLFHLKLQPMHCILGMLPYALWTARAVLRRRLPTATRVSLLLAGIPLADWILLLPMFLAAQAPASALWLPPLALVAGRLAQRLTPAT